MDGPTDEEIRYDPVALAERGENPTVLARVASGWVVFGLSQLLPGYCVLLASPEVREVNDLSPGARTRFLADMTSVGDAVRDECRPLRLNYELLGNELPILHAHVRPRYAWEDEALRLKPVSSYGERLALPEHSWRQPKHRALMERLRARLA